MFGEKLPYLCFHLLEHITLPHRFLTSLSSLIRLLLVHLNVFFNLYSFLYQSTSLFLQVFDNKLCCPEFGKCRFSCLATNHVCSVATLNKKSTVNSETIDIRYYHREVTLLTFMISCLVSSISSSFCFISICFWLFSAIKVVLCLICSSKSEVNFATCIVFPFSLSNTNY